MDFTQNNRLAQITEQTRLSQVLVGDFFSPLFCIVSFYFWRRFQVAIPSNLEPLFPFKFLSIPLRLL